VYRVFENLVLIGPIQELTDIVTKKLPISKQFKEKDAGEFVGDALECAFRNPSDPRNKPDTLIQDFLIRWKFSDKILLRQLVDMVNILARNEVPLIAEQSFDLRIAKSFVGAKFKFHR
jgi:hypothetical protein